MLNFHVFHTDDCPAQILADQQACVEKHGFTATYHCASNDGYEASYVQHGRFIEDVLNDAAADEVVCILDLDCLPTNREMLQEAYEWALVNQSFVGNAQCVGHNFLRNTIYAAPSMLMVHKQAWERLGRPTMSRIPVSSMHHLFARNPELKASDDAHQVNIDTAQLLSIYADRVGFPYRKLLPIGYDENPSNGLGDGSRPWALGPYGHFGVGTHYPGSWHYFRITRAFNGQTPNLWMERVREIVSYGIGDPKFPFTPWRSMVP